MKTKYTYKGCHEGVMYWESATTIDPRDSRSEEIRCGWVWFWTSAGMTIDLATVPGVPGLTGDAAPA